MKLSCSSMAAICFVWASGTPAAAQAPASTSTELSSASSTSAPTLVRLDGQLKTPTGEARTGNVTLVVALYAEKDDTTPLWVEPQVVTLDQAGRYTIFAGATLPDGVPLELLSGSTPGRWLGVGVQGEAEQFRMMLVTVPYALKAREADTLAGKSAADFVLTSSLTDTVKTAMKASGVGLAGGSSTGGTGPGISGTLNVIQKGDGGAAIADATGFVEIGGNVGIGSTTTPGATLDVNKATTGATAIFVRNPTAGTGNYARLDIKTDAAGGRGLFDAYSSTFATSANSVQSGVSFTGIGAGGFSIALQDPAAPMRFYTGAGPSERMRITSSGTVGIGTTTPAFRLEVVDPSNTGLRVQTNTAGGKVASFGGFGEFQVDAPGVVGGRLAVKGDGRVGVGTPNPSSQFHVTAPSSSSPISAMKIDVGSFGNFSNAQASSFFRALDVGSGGPSAFLIRGDGNVGIGTDSPDERLTVTGAVQSTTGGFKFPDGTTQTTAANAVNTVINNTSAAAINPTGSSWGSVLHLNVPEGRYLLLANIMFWNSAIYFGQNNSRSWSCRFSGDDPGGYSFTLGGNEFMTATLHAPVFVSSGGVDVECLAFGGPSNYSDIIPWTRRLTAVKLEGLLNGLIY